MPQRQDKHMRTEIYVETLKTGKTTGTNYFTIQLVDIQYGDEYNTLQSISRHGSSRLLLQLWRGSVSLSRALSQKTFCTHSTVQHHLIKFALAVFIYLHNFWLSTYVALMGTHSNYLQI